MKSILALGGFAVLTALAAGPAAAQDRIRFGTNWLAEAEHGGFYQAVADGTYARYGLEVEIVPGGPQTGNRALLLSGQIDFYMAGNLLAPLSAIEQDVPVIEVAAIFQKEPQVFLTHPDQGMETLGDLARLDTIFLGAEGFTSFFQWMKATFPGFRDEQYRPYSYSPVPFIADPRSAQQGYVTSEPFAIEREAGWAPKAFLLADYGFDTYSTLIETTVETVETRPEIVQRFVDASIIGWYNYLYGDNTAANALIKEHNPEMTDDLLAYSLNAMKEYGLVDSGITLTEGIGCMEGARFTSFYDKMVAAGVLQPGIDIETTYTTEFVCKGVGLELRPN